jgi:O-antigen/teichoic acid export membrane protein
MVSSAVLVILVAPTSVSLLLGRVVGDVGALLVLSPDLWKTPPRLVRNELRGLIEISLPLVPATLASSLIVASPRIALDTVQSTDEVGRYAFAAKFGSVISLLVAQPFALAWLPAMFQMKEQGDPPERFGAVIEFYIIAAAAVGTTVYKTFGAARDLLSSERFPLDMGVLAVALGANVAVGLLQAVNMGAYLRARTSSQVPPYAVAGAVALPMAMWLGKSYGAVGAAMAQFLVYCALAGALYWVSQRLFPVIVNWRRLVLRTSFIAAAAFASYYVTNGLGAIGRLADLALFVAILLPIWIVVVGSLRQRVISTSVV